MIEIKNLTKKYDGKVAVEHLSLSISDGDIYGFIGANGAGKTSTIKQSLVFMLDEGDILINGHSIQSEPILCKQQVAYIPDNPDLYEHLTGYQFINFIADLYHVSSEDRKIAYKHMGIFSK